MAITGLAQELIKLLSEVTEHLKNKMMLQVFITQTGSCGSWQ